MNYSRPVNLDFVQAIQLNQLIAITHQIHVAFQEYPSRETRAVFVDISKAFDNKVWNDCLLYKLESNGISGPLLNLIRDFLKDSSV